MQFLPKKLLANCTKLIPTLQLPSILHPKYYKQKHLTTKKIWSMTGRHNIVFKQPNKRNTPEL